MSGQVLYLKKNKNIFIKGDLYSSRTKIREYTLYTVKHIYTLYIYFNYLFLFMVFI